MAWTGTFCSCSDLDQRDELAAFGRVLERVVVVAEDGIRVGLVGVLERLGDEVGSDDLEPERVPQDAGAVVRDGLVDNVPDLDLALVAADDGVNVLTHPLEQLLAGRSWSVVRAKKAAAEPTPQARTPAPVHPRSIRVRDSAWRSVGDVRGWIRAGEHPVGCLGVPDEHVSRQLHAVAQAKVHEGVGGGKSVAVGAFVADG